MEMKKEYTEAKNFWNQVSLLTDEYKREYENCDKEEEWKSTPSPKLFDATQTLTNKEKVLDYGCGTGWATVAIAKGGCKDVTAVEVAKNAADYTEYVAKVFGVSDSVKVINIADTWLSEEEDEKYDGIFCSNVVDVLPTEVSFNIIKNLARIAKKDAAVIISMNFYKEPKADPERGIVIKDGNCMFVNDVLRLVLRTDEEWAETFEQYFEIIRLDHFAWPGEEKETRRLFYLKKK